MEIFLKYNLNIILFLLLLNSRALYSQEQELLCCDNEYELKMKSSITGNTLKWCQIKRDSEYIKHGNEMIFDPKGKLIEKRVYNDGKIVLEGILRESCDKSLPIEIKQNQSTRENTEDFSGKKKGTSQNSGLQNTIDSSSISKSSTRNKKEITCLLDPSQKSIILNILNEYKSELEALKNPEVLCSYRGNTIEKLIKREKIYFLDIYQNLSSLKPCDEPLYRMIALKGLFEAQWQMLILCYYVQERPEAITFYPGSKSNQSLRYAFLRYPSKNDVKGKLRLVTGSERIRKTRKKYRKIFKKIQNKIGNDNLMNLQLFNEANRNFSGRIYHESMKSSAEKMKALNDSIL